MKKLYLKDVKRMSIKRLLKNIEENLMYSKLSNDVDLAFNYSDNYWLCYHEYMFRMKKKLELI